MSTMYRRSRRRLPAFPPTSADPRICALLFGELIRYLRERDGRPTEQVAPLVGLTAAGWEAIEAGHAPDSVELMLLMATVLHLDESWLVPMLTLCARAYEKQ